MTKLALICASLILLAAAVVPAYAQNGVPADYEGHGETPYGTFAWQLGNGGAANARWSGGLVNWYYNPAGQPVDLSTAQIVAVIQRGMARWSDVCNIAFAYQGETTVTPNLNATFSTTDRIAVVGWGPLTGTRASFAGYTSFWYLNSGTMIDSDMVINTAINPPFGASRLLDLEALIVHETGHMLGINHSDVRESVMFASPYNSYKYQRTLRGDDASACAQIYGTSFQSETNRVFNWAEVTYEQYFAPAGGVSAEHAGYLYRYYSNTDSYIGFKDGTFYVLFPGSEMAPVGAQADLLPAAVNAGF